MAGNSAWAPPQCVGGDAQGAIRQSGLSDGWPGPEALYLDLPASVKWTAQMVMENGGPLPSGLSFDAATMTLIGTAVPPEVRPIRGVLILAGERTTIEISPGDDGA